MGGSSLQLNIRQRRACAPPLCCMAGWALPHAYNEGSPLLPKRYIFNHRPTTRGKSPLPVCRENLVLAEITPRLNPYYIRVTPGSQYMRSTRLPTVVGSAGGQ